MRIRSFLTFVLLTFLVSSTRSPAEIGNIIVEPSAAKIPEISRGIENHWIFLHERARESGKTHKNRKYTDARMKNNDLAVQVALETLRAAKHQEGTGKVLILGGASETELAPLFDAFSEVHVADLSSITLKDTAEKYRGRKGLFLHQADLSGIPAEYQNAAYERLVASGRGENPTPEAVAEYFKNFPKNLNRLDFATGDFDLVLSLVVAEYLPYAPVAAAFEKVRETKKTDRKAVDDLFGESFFYSAEVMATFETVLFHHRDELMRLGTPHALTAFSCWMRPDDFQAEKAPAHLKQSPLLRVGDDRVTEATWDRFFQPWGAPVFSVRERNIGPNPKSILNLFVLKKE